MLWKESYCTSFTKQKMQKKYNFSFDERSSLQLFIVITSFENSTRMNFSCVEKATHLSLLFPSNLPFLPE